MTFLWNPGSVDPRHLSPAVTENNTHGLPAPIHDDSAGLRREEPRGPRSVLISAEVWGWRGSASLCEISLFMGALLWLAWPQDIPTALLGKPARCYWYSQLAKICILMYQKTERRRVGVEADSYLLNTLILRLEVSVLCEAVHFFKFQSFSSGWMMNTLFFRETSSPGDGRRSCTSVHTVDTPPRLLPL